jgi:Co/Zn/Cd efflux system component
MIGLVATVVITNWSWSLVRTAGAVLLDASPDPVLPEQIAARLEKGGNRISGLHLWRLGPGHITAVISLCQTIRHCASARLPFILNTALRRRFLFKVLTLGITRGEKELKKANLDCSLPLRPRP